MDEIFLSKWENRKARDERLLEYGFGSYSAYMRSSLWKSRKIRFEKKYKKRCWCCGVHPRKYLNIELHHESYENVCEEPDGDLKWVCSSCHTQIHVLENRGEPLKLCAEAVLKHRRREQQVRRYRHNESPVGERWGKRKKIKRWDKLSKESEEALLKVAMNDGRSRESAYKLLGEQQHGYRRKKRKRRRKNPWAKQKENQTTGVPLDLNNLFAQDQRVKPKCEVCLDRPATIGKNCFKCEAKKARE